MIGKLVRECVLLLTGIDGAGVGLGVRWENPAGEDNAFGADAGMGADVAAEFVQAGVAELALPEHADFSGVMPEVAEDAATAHVHIILNDGVPHVSEV